MTRTPDCERGGKSPDPTADYDDSVRRDFLRHELLRHDLPFVRDDGNQ
ncbi:MAG: hypothetical protein ACXW1M_04715 [Acidimicrobiia bacterium]